MKTALLVALLISSAFHDRVSCTVQGYVYRMQEVDNVVFERADSCVGVRTKADGNTVFMESPTFWVQVIVPPEYGHRRFMYRWGSEVAHIGPETVPVVADRQKEG